VEESVFCFADIAMRMDGCDVKYLKTWDDNLVFFDSAVTAAVVFL
jgi:hypothetical protein